jgi:hypothetical protein
VPDVELPDPDEPEERRDKIFGRRVALTTALYAVVLALASLGGSNAMKEMLVEQQHASNQWAYYQAKVVREHLNRANKMMVEAQLAPPSQLEGAERTKYEALLSTYAEEEKRMNADKKEIERVARAHEAARDANQARDPYFDYAEVMLQIAIVMASVSIISASRPIFVVSLVLAVLGTLLAINGFTLWVRVPLLHS